MQPLNPFLRAFFASKLPPQCLPPAHHILLVPTTEFLLTAIDVDTQLPFHELVASEDFLASHVLRIPGGLAPFTNSRETTSLRESKTKARQYSTLDGRTVVIKDVFVYSNKGFKSLNQAQLLYDEIRYSDSADTPQWLIYYISKPLVGTPDPATLPGQTLVSRPPKSLTQSKGETLSNTFRKDQMEITTFNGLLNSFPLIARQMQPGLEHLLRQFRQGLEKVLPVAPSSITQIGAEDVRDYSANNGLSSSYAAMGLDTSLSRTISIASTFTAENNDLRRATEDLIVSAIEIFQDVDKQQLAMLAAATNLSGPVVERMIERYMIEQVHDTVLFPRVCVANEFEDGELGDHIKQMMDVDISQVGIEEGDGHSSKKELQRRLAAGVEAFKKMGVAGSPQEMMDILLDTERRITSSVMDDINCAPGAAMATNQTKVSATDADTLVSLLLMVIMRSPIRKLQARLAYMRDFTFIGDVETGEAGYALSTYEAVLSYLSTNFRGLRRVSRANRTLWQAVKSGNLAAVRRILEPHATNDDSELSPDDGDVSSYSAHVAWDQSADSLSANNDTRHQPLEDFSRGPDSRLAHVFPFQADDSMATNGDKPKLKKRVSMDTRSITSSSGRSWTSGVSSAGSGRNSVSGEMTAEQLSQTEDFGGNSILMMAVEHRRPSVLEYLLQLGHLFSIQHILQDRNNDGTSLLSAAVQSGHEKMTNTILNYLESNVDGIQQITDYFKVQDSRGRTVAHYIFNAPSLIPQLGHLLPWQLKDKSGQTPLFAVFRSYDHPNYSKLVETSIAAAANAQQNQGDLQLDDHVDNKGNTLLHIVSDTRIMRVLLNHCNSDPNAFNDRRFTPLMMASKFARLDVIRVFFNDLRVDLQARDLRGFTAIELAKDDEVRNRIDDALLLSTMWLEEGRKTTIIRSFFVEDASIRLVIKSGARNGNSTVTVTTCRRSLQDFENLSRWLSLEHPASYMPSILHFRSPFQIPSKPSRQMLRDIQIRLNGFLTALLAHPTFGTHEMVWEFFLVPDIDPSMLAERTQRKAEARLEKLREEYEPLTNDTTEVELFVTHARDQIFNLYNAYRTAFRHVNGSCNISVDLAEAQRLSASHLSRLTFLSTADATGYTRYASSLATTENTPSIQFRYVILGVLSSVGALLGAFSRPTSLIRRITDAREVLARHQSSASRSQRWPSTLGLLDDNRSRREQESLEKVERAKRELMTLGCELRYTQQTVATELAGWQEGHARAVKQGLKDWAKRTVVVERDRLEGMKRAIRAIERETRADS